LPLRLVDRDVEALEEGLVELPPSERRASAIDLRSIADDCQRQVEGARDVVEFD